MSKIEQIITEIEEYIDGCKMQPLSNTKLIVNKDEIQELLSELRLKIPEEIKKYQKIINNREKILSDAQQKADAMLAEATAQTNELVSEHEIMQQAYIQANDYVQQAQAQAQMIVDNATNDANNIRMGAMQYTDDILANLENIISYSIKNATEKHEAYMRALNTSLEVVMANRKELQPQETVEELVEGTEATDDYDDDDEFLVPMDDDDL